MRSFPYVQTSVFVDSKYLFGGNQLATFWDIKSNAQLSSEEMQGIALEMNFSETTFLNPSKLADCVSKVRIFTPGREVPFAGHPTLGTAYVMKYTGLVKTSETQAVLELGVGPILVEFLSEDMIRMSQPPPEFLKKWGDREAIAAAISLRKEDVSHELPIEFVSTGFPFLIVPLNSLSAVRRAQPNRVLIQQTLENQPSHEILVFSTEVVNEGSDVHARMFAPLVGVLEDPATGSAAGPLAAYLEYYKVLSRKVKGDPFVIEQGYEIQRPSQLIAQVLGKEFEGVLVSGKVKLVADGTFYIDS